MANREIGECKLTAGDATYTLRYGAFAIAELETELNRPMISIATELENADKRRVKTVIAALWAGLQEHHEGLTIRDAARIMDTMGFVDAALKVAEALNLAFPPATVGAARGGTANPPNRAARRKTAATKR